MHQPPTRIVGLSVIVGLLLASGQALASNYRSAPPRAGLGQHDSLPGPSRWPDMMVGDPCLP
jgi:hypothetical protein